MSSPKTSPKPDDSVLPPAEAETQADAQGQATEQRVNEDETPDIKTDLESEAEQAPKLDTADATSLDPTPAPPADVDPHPAEISHLRTLLSEAQNTISSQSARLADYDESSRKLKDEHAFLVAAKEAVELRLREEERKREAAEEAVESLRGQVETARRGVMTLQKQEKERKRASMMGVPSGMGGLGGLGGLGGSEVLMESPDSGAVASGSAAAIGSGTNKRSSVLLRHRRVSSQSEPDAHSLVGLNLNIGGGVGASGSSVVPPSIPSSGLTPPAVPPRSGLRELRLGAGAGATSPNLGTGAHFVTSPTTPTGPTSRGAAIDDPYAQHAPVPHRSISGSSEQHSPSRSLRALDEARTELDATRSELVSIQARLAESEEARQASEDCLRALREFISGSASPPVEDGASGTAGGGVDFSDPTSLVALKGISLPPLPTDRDPDEPPEVDHSQAGKKGWNFRLPSWKAAPVGSPSSQLVEPATPRNGLSPPPSVRSSSFSPLPTPLEEPGHSTQATPLANFVNSWTRTIPTAQPSTPAPAGRDETTVSGTTPATATATTATPRGLGAFFRRGTTASQNKDLPNPPPRRDSAISDADEVGSVGAERVDEVDPNRLPLEQRLAMSSGVGASGGDDADVKSLGMGVGVAAGEGGGLQPAAEITGSEVHTREVRHAAVDVGEGEKREEKSNDEGEEGKFVGVKTDEVK